MAPLIKSFSAKNLKIQKTNDFKTWSFSMATINEARAQVFVFFEKIESKGLKGRMEWDNREPGILKLIVFSKNRKIGEIIFKSLENYKGEERKKKVYKGEFAIIIDDIGYSKEIVEEIVQIKEPLTLSVLPFLPESELCAEIAQKNGKEIMIHMPMESNNGGETEEGVIRVDMREEEIRDRIRRAINSLPTAKGMNNHKGSKITQREDLMEIILSELKGRDLFFIDSKTSNNSKVSKIAKKVGIPFSERDVFIDSLNSKSQIRRNILALFILAKKKRKVIGIAHPYPETIYTLRELLPEAEIYGVKPVFVSEIIKK
ncbi:MAG: divergent polysaccharide deacetylase family protein [Candidatus Aminicenantia bacterium]